MFYVSFAETVGHCLGQCAQASGSSVRTTSACVRQVAGISSPEACRSQVIGEGGEQRWHFEQIGHRRLPLVSP